MSNFFRLLGEVASKKEGGIKKRRRADRGGVQKNFFEVANYGKFYVV